MPTNPQNFQYGNKNIFRKQGNIEKPPGTDRSEGSIDEEVIIEIDGEPTVLSKKTTAPDANGKHKKTTIINKEYDSAGKQRNLDEFEYRTWTGIKATKHQVKWCLNHWGDHPDCYVLPTEDGKDYNKKYALCDRCHKKNKWLKWIRIFSLWFYNPDTV